ncbi:MAG: hypothetical protein ACI9TH_001846 [Kiritimatiellia bacterium]|jgi:hypothetical protein
MSIVVKDIDLRVINLHTRIPFKYGIATLTRVPHLFVRIQIESQGRTQWGVSADSLPPKWFTKNPATSFQFEIEEMITVIRQTCAAALTLKADTPFAFWQALRAELAQCPQHAAYPGLLRGFGISLVERAVIDAFCRLQACTFSKALHNNLLGVQLGDIHPSLAGMEPADLLPAKPAQAVHIRHTVGLGDPLTDSEIPTEERVDDGLPQSLSASIQTYGLRWFKIKICGDTAIDLPRLKAIAGMLEGQDIQFTLDGNEQFHSVAAFQDCWSQLTGDPDLEAFMRQLVFVEQPFHRDIALNTETSEALLAWLERPPMIIDESDADLHSASDAMNQGYVGTSHKNCKGVFKGIANACLIKRSQHGILSGEDLVNVGPVALLQDLAVAASLGITHIERNGHHYFRGLDAFPASIQLAVLEQHGDLYETHSAGFPTLAIQQGEIDIHSVLESPFGYSFDLDPKTFISLEDWSYDMLEA